LCITLCTVIDIRWPLSLIPRFPPKRPNLI